MTFKGFTIADAAVERVGAGLYLHLQLRPARANDFEYRSICIENKSNHLAQQEGQSEVNQLARAAGVSSLLDASELKGKKVCMRRQGRRVDWERYVDDGMALEFVTRPAAPSADGAAA